MSKARGQPPKLATEATEFMGIRSNEVAAIQVKLDAVLDRVVPRAAPRAARIRGERVSEGGDARPGAGDYLVAGVAGRPPRHVRRQH